MAIERMLTEEMPARVLVARVLAEAGIEYVFGISGGHTGRIVSGLSQVQNSVRMVTVREESLAGVMAEVYGRLTRRPGVMLGQGPWVLGNGLIGTLEAVLSSSPMLPLTDCSGPPPPADAALIAAAADRVLAAERPVIIAGNGVRIAQAYDQLRDLAEMAGLPVATTAAGKGCFPETHPLALGVFGTFGTPAANACLGEADLVLVVGSKLSPSDTAWENTRLLDPTRQIFVQI